jgi:hypothetical protein
MVKGGCTKKMGHFVTRASGKMAILVVKVKSIMKMGHFATKEGGKTAMNMRGNMVKESGIGKTENFNTRVCFILTFDILANGEKGSVLMVKVKLIMMTEL